MNRRALVAVVAVIAVVSAAVGWVAGQRIKSPAEIAAEQAPPEPSLITVPVEMRELSQSLVVRGTVRSNESTPLEATSVSGETIITRLTKETGSELVEGDVAIEVAGRPVFVLEGALPVFRNLIPTLDGPDVEQLERALSRLGHDPGKIDGIFDGDTADAVEELYRDAGYKPVEPTEADLASLKVERQAVDQAVADLALAEETLAEAKAGPPESLRIQLDQAVSEAEDRLEEAEAASGIAAAIEQRKAAEAEAEAAKTAAETAAARLAEAKGGTHPDTNAPPTNDELAVLEAENEAAAEAKTAADTAVTEAKQAETDASSGDEPELELARSNLALAEASRTEQLATDTDAAEDGVKTAKTRLTEARSSFNSTQAIVDSQFPAAELYFLPSLPRKIQSISVEVGQRPQGAVMTVTGSGTSITSAVAQSDRRLVSVGDKAILEDEDLGITAEAVISFIAESPGGGDTPSDRYVMKIDPVDDLPEDALNVNFRITIPVTASDGEVMAVPLAALSAGTDGTTRVEVERSSGETELVRVNAGLKAEGFVEINVLEGDLEAGDRVVVGRDLILPGQTESDSSQQDEEDEDALSVGD